MVQAILSNFYIHPVYIAIINKDLVQFFLDQEQARC